MRIVREGGEGRWVECVEVIGAGRVSGGRQVDAEHTARVGELLQEPAVGQPVVEHDRVAPPRGTGRTGGRQRVQIDRVAWQQGTGLVVDGDPAGVHSLNDVRRSDVGNSVGWNAPGKTLAIEVDAGCDAGSASRRPGGLPVQQGIGEPLTYRLRPLTRLRKAAPRHLPDRVPWLPLGRSGLLSQRAHRGSDDRCHRSVRLGALGDHLTARLRPGRRRRQRRQHHQTGRDQLADAAASASGDDRDL